MAFEADTAFIALDLDSRKVKRPAVKARAARERGHGGVSIAHANGGRFRQRDATVVCGELHNRRGNVEREPAFLVPHIDAQGRQRKAADPKRLGLTGRRRDVDSGRFEAPDAVRTMRTTPLLTDTSSKDTSPSSVRRGTVTAT